MKTNTRMPVLMLLIIWFSANPAFAATPEHSIVKPIPKSILDKSSEHKDYTYEFPFYDSENKVVHYLPVKGTLLKLSYQIFGKDRQRTDGILSSVEIIRTYRKMALERGGEILWERGEGGRLSFTLPDPNNSKIWCHVSARDGYYELDIIQKERKSAKMNVGTKEMKKELDEKGRITLYAILFDFDQFGLKKDSMATLHEIADLLLTYPELRIEIQGHTDNQGEHKYNMMLSKKRAETVRFCLIKMGVDASRLSAGGYGSTKPVAPNDTSEGRAKNRRVVLIER